MRQDRRARIARRQHLLDLRQARERAHDLLRLRRRDQDVDVADRFAHTADAAGGRDCLDRGAPRQGAHDLFGGRQGDRQRQPPRARSEPFDFLEDGAGGLLAESRQRRDLARFERRLQVRHRIDVELTRELQRAFGPDARDVHQHQRRRRDLAAPLFEGFESTRLDVFGDLRPDALADAVDLGDSAVGGHRFDRLAVMLDPRRGIPITGDPVPILAEQLHRVGQLANDRRHLAVFHAATMYHPARPLEGER